MSLLFRPPSQVRERKCKLTHTTDVHAFLGWFDISFEACHKPVKFSTGPHSRYTHWKQTVFYVPEMLTLSVGDEIKGRLSCAPNARNNRDLDIAIEYESTGKAAMRSKMDYKMCVTEPDLPCLYGADPFHP